MAQTTVESAATARPKSSRKRDFPRPFVDCDIHPLAGNPDVFAPYLPSKWQSYYRSFGLRVPTTSPEYFATRPRAAASRSDAWPPSGGPPGSDLGFLQEQLLDRWGIDCGILNPVDHPPNELRDGDYARSLARALNDWIVAEWLEPEPRLYASLSIPIEKPDLAVEEIHRLGGNPRFVQVYFNRVRTREPMGNRKYWPIYEATVESGLPLAVHAGGMGGNTVTGAGLPSYYYEDHVAFSQAFQAQVLSMIVEGVFEQFPDLKVVLLEGGFAWVPSLMHRFEHALRRWGAEVPHLKRAPYEYMRRHFWFTTQPMEEPHKYEFLKQVLDEIDMDGHIMFATDYPHWDFDAPDQTLPHQLSPELRHKILSTNACELYGFNK